MNWLLRTITDCQFNVSIYKNQCAVGYNAHVGASTNKNAMNPRQSICFNVLVLNIVSIKPKMVSFTALLSTGETRYICVKRVPNTTAYLCLYKSFEFNSIFTHHERKSSFK